MWHVTAIALMSAKQAVVSNRRNIWRLARYKIGPRMFGLDRAGNLIFFRSFGKNSFLGWTGVVDGDSKFALTRPMHWKAATLRESLQAMPAEAVASLAKESAEDEFDTKVSPQRTVDATVMEIVALNDKRLRIMPFVSRVYKLFYLSCWFAVVFVFSVQYSRFRQWLNPPARAGVEDIENKIMAVPRLVVESVTTFFATTTSPAVQSAVTDAVTPVVAPVVEAVKEQGAAAARKLGFRPEAEIQAERRAAEARIQMLNEQDDEEKSTWRRNALIGALLSVGVFLIV